MHAQRNHLIQAGIAIVAITVGSLGRPAGAVTAPGVLARFEGQTIDLSQGWGQAHACTTTIIGTACYRTEAEMNQASAVAPSTRATRSTRSSSPTTATGSCSSSLRLYDGTSFTGSVLALTTTGSLIQLSSYGFDNVTSSYKVGACNANLYSGLQSGLYPGATGANSQSSVMLSGWDNTISSVVIS